MEQVLAVAKTLNDLHKEKYGKRMDQMRMHKLLYFIQKESLKATNEPLFDSAFQGWKFGPVLPEVRAEYNNEVPYAKVEASVSEDTKALVKKIFDKYEKVSSWDLANLSHNEFSWQLSRAGLEPDENGNVEISLDAIRMDAISDSIAAFDGE